MAAAPDMFGGDMSSDVLKFFLAFVFVLVLIGAAAWLVRRFGAMRLSNNTRGGRMPRLAVIDATAVDGRRRLVLVRRDNVEHLLMIGGPTDIVVEPNILRTPGGRDAAPTRGDAGTRGASLGEADDQSMSDIDMPPPPPMPEPPARAARPMPDRAPPMPPRDRAMPERPMPEPMAERPAPLERRPDPFAGLNVDALRGEPAPRPAPRPDFPPRGPVRQEPQIAPLAPAKPAAAPDANADKQLEEMAKRLEAALRSPGAPPIAPPAAAPAPAKPDMAKAEPRPTPPPVPAAPPVAPEVNVGAPAAPAKSEFDSLEAEMASLLGRPKKPT